MNAAREILASQLSDDPKNPQYEYISVILEASKKTAGSYALAEAEFAPDGKGRQGVMSDVSENRKWKVRSSKARVNPDDAAGSQRNAKLF